MNDDAWARHVAGDPLTPEEERSLVNSASSDANVAARLSADATLDGLLRSLGEAQNRPEDFERRLRERLALERSGPTFEDRLRVEVSRRGGLRGSTRRRPGTRRFAVTSASWIPWLAAAALVLSLVALATRTSPLSPEEAAAARETSARREQADRDARAEIARQVVERLQAEDRLSALRREEAAARKEAARQNDDAATHQRLEESLARFRRELEQEEARLEQARAAEQEAREALQPTPAPTATTVAAAARVETVTGDAHILGDRPTRALPGSPIAPGQGLEVQGSLTFGFPDGTRVEVSSGTLVNDIRDLDTVHPGKHLSVMRGRVAAEITPQPSDRPLIFSTPHAEVRVLGTSLSLSVGASTRVEVREGRVRFGRPKTGRAVEVAAGEAGIAAEGRDLAVLKLTLLERMIESNEGAMAWVPFKADPIELALSADQAAGGRRSLRLAYAWQDPARGAKGWGGAGHALKLLPSDSYLCFRLYVASADDTAKVGVITMLEDEGSWYMGNIRLDKCPRKTWFTYAVPLRGNPGKNNIKGGKTFDPERITSFDITLGGGSSTVYVDDVILSADSPPGARGPKR